MNTAHAPRWRRRLGWTLAVLASFAALALAYWRQPSAVHLVLVPYVGDQPLALNSGRYPNPAGDGKFSVRDFQFFLSNILLEGDARQVPEHNSYHLVRFDDGPWQLTLDNLPRQRYHTLSLGIGVDETANHSLQSIGDLDPNGRMAWSWEVGYKFVLLEGSIYQGDRRIPMVYHVGFSENYRRVALPLQRPWYQLGNPTYTVKIDLAKLFNGQQPVDMQQTPSIKFDRQDARRLAANFSTFLSIE